MSQAAKRIAALPQPIIHHIHLPGIVPYQRAATLQDYLVKKHLTAKQPANRALPPPPPYLITAEFAPVYTCGRREVGHVSQSQQDYLRWGGRAAFVEAQRGGQTTFHGPGQLIVYPILDLQRHALTPKCYVNMLEEVTIATLAHYHIKGTRTENTGVWTSADHKIASIGVHMRRNVTSHGVGINFYTDLGFFDRIVACGLEGKRTVSVEKFGIRTEDGVGAGVEGPGTIWMWEFGKRLRGAGGEAVGGMRVGWREVERLLVEAGAV